MINLQTCKVHPGMMRAWIRLWCITLVRHYSGMAETTLICLRSRMPRNGSQSSLPRTYAWSPRWQRASRRACCSGAISSKPPARASRMWRFDVERDFALTDSRRTALPMRERVAPIGFACDCLLSTLRRFVVRVSATRHPADRGGRPESGVADLPQAESVRGDPADVIRSG